MSETGTDSYASKPRVRIELAPFDIVSEFTDPDSGDWVHPMGVFYGFRRTGKTTKMVNLLYEIKDKFGSAHLFSPTAASTGAFGIIFNRSNCWRWPSFELLELIEKFQLFLTEHSPVGATDRDKNCLIVMDDLSSKKAVTQNPKLTEFACNCRNLKITLFISAQHFKQLQPPIRNNCDFFSCNSERNGLSLKALYDEVFRVFVDLNAFTAALNFFTKGYGSLVWVNGGSDRQDLPDCVFVYKVPQRKPDFHIACQISEVNEQLFAESKEDMKRAKVSKILSTFGLDGSGDSETNTMRTGETKIVRRGASMFPSKKSAKEPVDEWCEDDEYFQEEDERVSRAWGASDDHGVQDEEEFDIVSRKNARYAPSRAIVEKRKGGRGSASGKGARALGSARRAGGRMFHDDMEQEAMVYKGKYHSYEFSHNN